MGKRKAGSQTGNLTPDHKKLGIDLFPNSELGVRYVVGKISTRATSFVWTALRSDLEVGSYELPKSRDSTQDDFGTIPGLHFRNPGNLCHLGEAPTGRRRVYYREYGGGILPSPGCGESCGPKCPWQVPTPKGVPNVKLTFCGWFLDVDSYEII